MKIASWNVNSIRARLEHVTTWLKANRPDVLFLQELKSTEFSGGGLYGDGLRKCRRHPVGLQRRCCLVTDSDRND